MKDYDNYDSIFTYQNYYKSLKKCNKGVSFKRSVQEYDQNAVTNIHETMSVIKTVELPKPRPRKQMVIRERGKERVITPIRIEDRVTQKTLCDFGLTASIRRSLIYDNGASTKGKGVNFTRRRLDKMFREAVREYGSHFYILKFDFKGYFDSIQHKTCRRILSEIFEDKRVVDITMKIIQSYELQRVKAIKNSKVRECETERIKTDGGVGICLGSQVSQDIALVIPNEIDHYIKDKASMHYYARFMDDGIIFAGNKEDLEELLKGMAEIAERLGLQFNPKKTFITSSSKGVTFMKVRYIVTNEGKIIKKLDKSGIKRMRTKLGKYRKKVDEGKMTADDVYNSMQSWLSHAKIAKSSHAVSNMLKLYDKLFDGYRITRHWKHAHNRKSPKIKSKNLQWSDGLETRKTTRRRGKYGLL